jgi:hypothetical protein
LMSLLLIRRLGSSLTTATNWQTKRWYDAAISNISSLLMSVRNFWSISRRRSVFVTWKRILHNRNRSDGLNVGERTPCRCSFRCCFITMKLKLFNWNLFESEIMMHGPSNWPIISHWQLFWRELCRIHRISKVPSLY